MYSYQAVEMLKGWRLNLSNLRKNYHAAASHYLRYANWMKFLAISFTSLATALSIGGISNDNIHEIILIIIAALNAGSLVFTGIEAKTGWTKLSKVYQDQSSKYNKLILIIEKALALQSDDISQLFDTIVNNYQSIEDGSMALPPSIENEQSKCQLVDTAIKYKKTHEDHTEPISLDV